MPNRTEAVVKVGTGRGFVIEAAGYPLRRRYVITAAHCLPRMPPRHAAAHAIERTFRRLLGPIGNRRRMVWAECIFVDPVADIAALAEPDANELPKESEAYQELTEADAVIPFPLGALTFTEEQRHSSGSGPFGGVFIGPPRASARGQMLSLDLRWVSCEVKSGGRSVSVTGGAPIESGMSGSPILGPDGAAIAVVSTSDQEGKGGLNPLLMDTLPGWLLRSWQRAAAVRQRTGRC